MEINDFAIKVISDSIIRAVGKVISTAHFDKTTKARVLSVNNDGTYTIEFWGKTQNVKCDSGKAIKVNDSVRVVIPQNDINNAFIP